MNKLTKQNQEQNYLVLPALMLQVWFERMRIEHLGELANQPKALPIQEAQNKLNINFSDWDMLPKKDVPVIEECLWGVRYGVMQFIDVKNALFFDKLPKETKFLCSPEIDKLRIANQENGEIGFSFRAVDTNIKTPGFYLGNLQPTFKYIAQEIEQGNGRSFCRPESLHKLDYLKSKICFMSGGQYPYDLATNLVSEMFYPQLKQNYVKKGISGKDFSVLIDGSFVINDDDFNCIAEDGKDLRICIPPSVYQSWGQEFTPSELEIINRGRTFEFDSQAENDYFNKINRLRFSRREINIFAKAKTTEKIIEVEPLREVINKQLDELEQEELQQKLQQKMLLPHIKSYCGEHKDFCFSEPSAYCSFLTDYGVPTKSYKVTEEAESGLFESGNEKLLLKMAAENRIFIRKNKIRFIKLYDRYPAEVEKYLSKYGKDITLTHEEELKVFGSNRNALMYLKVKSQDVYLNYVMPEMRRKRIPFSEEDIPMLIRLSYDNPLLLEEFIDYHGRFSPEYEVELFFKTEENCREKYISQHGIDLVNLIQHASDYGATQTEQEVLNKAEFKELSKSFPMLKKWNGYQIGALGNCIVCHEMSGEKGCGGRYCHHVDCIAQGLPVVTSLLRNIARRNYLLGAG